MRQNAKNRQSSPRQNRMLRNSSAQQLPAPKANHLRNHAANGMKMHSNSVSQLPKAAPGAPGANIPPRPVNSQLSRPVLGESDPLSGALPQSLKKRRDSNTRILINADNSVPQPSSQATPAQMPAQEQKAYVLPVDEDVTNEVKMVTMDAKDQAAGQLLMADAAQPTSAQYDLASQAPS